MHSTEWQKLGLLQTLLIWFIEKVTQDEIDLIITAETPDITPGLLKVITKNMILAPCG